MGTGGNDVFRPLTGIDTVDGRGGGIDTLIVDYSALPIGLTSRIDLVVPSPGGLTSSYSGNLGDPGSSSRVTFTEIERFDVKLGTGSDSLTFNAAGSVASGIKLNGGEGGNVLKVDFSSFSDTTFRMSGVPTVTPDGVVEAIDSNRGTFLNWQTVEIRLGSGANVFTGAYGSDVIRSISGSDTIDGGTGTDEWTGDFGASTTGMVFAYNFSTKTGSLGSNPFANIEAVRFNGGSGSDTVSLIAPSGSQAFSGGGGSGIDLLVLDMAGATGKSFVVPASGPVTLGGAQFSGFETYDIAVYGDLNTVTLGGGNDIVRTRGGEDAIDLGDGIDKLVIDNSARTTAASLVYVLDALTGSGNGASYANAEKIDWTGGAGDDYVSLSGPIEGMIDGGGGTDLLSIDQTGHVNAQDQIRIISDEQGRFASNAGAGYTSFRNIEQLEITFGDEANIVSVDPGAVRANPAASLSVNGGGGRDRLELAVAGLSGVTFRAAANGAVTSSVGTFAGFEDYVVVLGGGTNSIETAGGDDLVLGGTGRDTIQLGAGNDSATGAEDIDTISYSRAMSSVTVSLALQGAAQNTLGAGLDTLDGFEYLVGSAFADTLTGDANDNLINGGAGNDVMDGGGGRDTISYAGAASGVTFSLALTGAQDTGGAGSDTAINFEYLTGSSFADRLTGDAGSNRIAGGAGDDIIEGGAGNDTLSGGDGIDTLSYAGAAARVVVDLSRSQQTTLGAGNDVVSGFENVTGSAFDDVFIGTAGANRFDGGAGSDTVDFSSSGRAAKVNLGSIAGQDTGGSAPDVLLRIERLVGTQLGDEFIGNASVNVLWGKNGNDILYGEGGNDVLIGGAGDDTLDGGTGTDLASYAGAAGGVTVSLAVAVAQDTGGAGIDTLTTIESLRGSALDDVLTGNAGTNTILGGEGSDLIEGGAGNDILAGEGGGDTVSYAHAAAGVFVSLAISSAQDTRGAGLDTLSDFENLTGSAGNDRLTGNSDYNDLRGLAGDDTLAGAAGNDRLFGGSGADRLIGGTGPDGFMFDVIEAKYDTVVDFVSGTDVIGLDRTVFAAVVGSDGDLAAGSFVIGTTATTADQHLIYDRTTGKLYYDADGVGGAARSLIAVFSGQPEIAAYDFFLF